MKFQLKETESAVTYKCHKTNILMTYVKIITSKDRSLGDYGDRSGHHLN